MPVVKTDSSVVDLDKIDAGKVGFFRFEKFSKGKYLLTNDVGDHIFLTEAQFRSFLRGSLKESDKIRADLQKKGFIRDNLDFDYLIDKWRSKRKFVGIGPSLHIVVVTLRCDHVCVYCQASSRPLDAKGYDMDMDTAKSTVDRIFETPNKNIAIEFQGGEPLLNWDVVKFIIKYSKEKAEKAKKDLQLRLVSNFFFLDDKKLKYLVAEEVNLCTSLDGPEIVHNKNRKAQVGCKGSYKSVTQNLKKVLEEYEKTGNKSQPGALVTVTRHSLNHPKEIVDEYLKWGYEAIYLRPLSPLGFAKGMWKNIGYSADEFIRFYKKALDYIIDLNLKKKKIFYEYFAEVILTKILTDYDPNLLELRSCCGAGIGQLLYNYDGKVYTCDEGRMIGDDTFAIGNVKKDSLLKIMGHKTVKAICTASCLEGLPCDTCVYKPYCGVCPVCNYAENENIFTQTPNSMRCEINKAIMGYLFKKLQDPKLEKIFKSWISRRERLKF